MKVYHHFYAATSGDLANFFQFGDVLAHAATYAILHQESVKVYGWTDEGEHIHLLTVQNGEG